MIGYKKNALLKLATLQSNSEAIKEWAKKRRTDMSLDFRSELLQFCERLLIDVQNKIQCERILFI
jgi:hypothetical protein